MSGPDKNESAPTSDSLILGENTLSLLHIESPSDISVLNPWHAGGGESYITDFTVRSGDSERHLIAKACVKLTPRETMEEWLDRRRILNEHGVQTPQLFAVDGATIVEEFIPYTLKEAYAAGSEQDMAILRQAYSDTYKRILGAGFRPISLHDVRSRGLDVVIVDLGEDLGPPQEAPVRHFSPDTEAERSFWELTR